MVGTILSNFWAALIAFTIYFISCYPFTAGIGIVKNAALIAILAFFLTFVVRGILSFILEDKMIKAEVVGEKVDEE